MGEQGTFDEQGVKSQQFEQLYKAYIEKGVGERLPYDLKHSKQDFLYYLVATHGLLLHGSPNTEIDILEPRQANCASKEFGNKRAVYAVEDPVLPIFYAIRNPKIKFEGVVISGFRTTRDNDDGHVSKVYNFSLHPKDLQKRPWSDGAVYILPRNSFVQGHNDDGHLIDEWASESDVRPLAVLAVTPEDFMYLDSVTSYKVY